MSLIRGNASAAAMPAGAVQLFFTDIVPDGHEVLTGISLPSHLYRQPRAAVIADPLALGASTTTHTLTDYDDSERVYVLNGTSLRRFSPFLGTSESMATCPVQPSYAVSTPHGIYVYAPVTGMAAATAGRPVYHYTPGTNSWTQVASLPAVCTASRAVYIPPLDCVVLIGGSSAYSGVSASTAIATTYLHDLTANRISSTGHVITAGHTYSAAYAGGTRVLVYGGTAGGCYLYDVVSGGWADVPTSLSATDLRDASSVTFARGDVLLILSSGEMLRLDVAASELVSSGSISGPAFRTPSTTYSATNAAAYSSAGLLGGELLLCSLGGVLCLCSLSAFEDAPRGRLFYARKV